MGSAVCAKTVVGLDLGDKYSQVLVVSPRGEVLDERRIRTTPTAFEEFFSKLKGTRVAMEAGSHSPWVSRQLKKSGQEVLVANPQARADHGEQPEVRQGRCGVPGVPGVQSDPALASD